MEIKKIWLTPRTFILCGVTYFANISNKNKNKTTNYQELRWIQFIKNAKNLVNQTQLSFHWPFKHVFIAVFCYFCVACYSSHQLAVFTMGPPMKKCLRISIKALSKKRFLHTEQFLFLYGSKGVLNLWPKTSSLTHYMETSRQHV